MNDPWWPLRWHPMVSGQSRTSQFALGNREVRVVGYSEQGFSVHLIARNMGEAMHESIHRCSTLLELRALLKDIASKGA